MNRFGGRALLCLEMGLGKTLISLWWLQQDHDGRLPAIVVCPASVKYAWQREAARIGLTAYVAETRTPKDVLGQPITIINYEILPYWLDVLSKINPKTLVIDECQYIKDPKSHRNKAVRLLGKNRPHILCLSGTPLLNRPIELFPILNLLRPMEYRKRFVFALRYCNPKRTFWGWDFSGASNLQELHGRLKKTCMVRYRKEEVMSNFPPKVRTVVPLQLPGMAEYRQAEKDFLNWLKSQDPEAVLRAKRAEEIVHLGYLLRLCGKLKLPRIHDWIRDCLESSEEKLVVFAKHRAVLDDLYSRWRTCSVKVDGSINGLERQKTIDRFKQDQHTRIFFGNIQAAGVGINLTEANKVVFAELAWRPADHTQAEDRCHRIGTTKPVWSFYLVARDTIEERLCRILQEKQNILGCVLDGYANSELAVFDLLLNEMRKQ